VPKSKGEIRAGLPLVHIEPGEGIGEIGHVFARARNSVDVVFPAFSNLKQGVGTVHPGKFGQSNGCQNHPDNAHREANEGHDHG
jgi:hypothetical protein